MQKFEYWIKDVTPDDAQGFLRIAGKSSWELVTIIIKHKPNNFTSPVQYPQIESFYSLIMKRIIPVDNVIFDSEYVFNKAQEALKGNQNEEKNGND